MSWTDERVEIMRKLWLDGRSAGYISIVLDCGLSRNAVIGKIHRLKLGGRTKDKRIPRPPRPERLPQGAHVLGRFNRLKFSPPKPPAPPTAPVVPQESLRVTLANLHACMCKWPLEGARYCGLPTPLRVSYCVRHRAIACIPLKDYRAYGSEARLVALAMTGQSKFGDEA